jgi:peptide chain release factor 3
LRDEVLRFAPGEERANQTVQAIRGEALKALSSEFPQEMETLQGEIELVRGAGSGFELDDFLAGTQSPVFFGSGINNFGVREILRALVDWAPPPQARDGSIRPVDPAEAPFSGFVFKIQANMDPNHRDRIAFLRVCSGRYEPGIKVLHRRLGRPIKLQNALTFMANERSLMETAVAGDIIGLHNHGQLQIGDTLTEANELIAFTSIPYFAPELFSRPRLRDPLKSKQLAKGLQQLGEEGAVQVFEPFIDSTPLLGAVGQLQFEVVEHRLRTEYGVEASFERATISGARWVTCDDDQVLKEFSRAQQARLARDVNGNLVYLADTGVNLRLTMERWPKVKFHATREHGQRIEA